MSMLDANLKVRQNLQSFYDDLKGQFTNTRSHIASKSRLVKDVVLIFFLNYSIPLQKKKNK